MDQKWAVRFMIVGSQERKENLISLDGVFILTFADFK